MSIWSQSLQHTGSNVDYILEDLKSRLEKFTDLEDIDHFLVWTYFTCAAASTSNELKKFFTDHLRDKVQFIRFRNIPLMLEFLEELWADGNSWPLTVQHRSDYICA